MIRLAFIIIALAVLIYFAVRVAREDREGN